jgi:hypothetical protein
MFLKSVSIMLLVMMLCSMLGGHLHLTSPVISTLRGNTVKMEANKQWTSLDRCSTNQIFHVTDEG